MTKTYPLCFILATDCISQIKNYANMMQPDERENGGSGNDPREIYYHENHESARPWWDVPSYFLGPVKFGKWDGVFVSIIINIFGAVLFLQGEF